MCKERRLVFQYRDGKLGTRSEENVTRHSPKCDVANYLRVLPVPKPHCPYFPLYALSQYLYSNKENQGNLSEERSPMGRESNPDSPGRNRSDHQNNVITVTDILHETRISPTVQGRE